MNNEEKQLWVSYWGDKSVTNRNALASYYYPKVVAIARTLASNVKVGQETVYEDALSYGSEGLLRCIDAFEPDRCGFMQYARRRIVGMYLDYREAEGKGRLEYNSIEDLIDIENEQRENVKGDDVLTELAKEETAVQNREFLFSRCRNAEEITIMRLLINGYSRYEISKKTKIVYRTLNRKIKIMFQRIKDS